MAILAQTFSRRGLTNVDQIVRMFRSKLSTIEIHAAFERLKDLGFLEWNEASNRFLSTYSRVATRDDVANRGVREYHKQVAKLAVDSIETQDTLIREFQSFAINVPVGKISVLKEMMRKFRSQVENELRDPYSEFSDNGDELYQMNLQFFRLTDQPWSNVSKVHTDTGARFNPSAELAAEIEISEDRNEITN